MPEYSNIQTYEKLQGVDFEPAVQSFCNVLQRIGLWNEEIKDAFNSFKWNEAEGGVESSMYELDHYANSLSPVKIRPLAVVCTAAADRSFKDNWICCELLLDAEDLKDYQNEEFREVSYGLVKALTFEMHQEFKQTGVYFTDEAQDGSDFDGIRTNSLEKLWQFDYGLIPLALEGLYGTVPSTHCFLRHDTYLEAWDADRWKEQPHHRIREK